MHKFGPGSRITQFEQLSNKLLLIFDPNIIYFCLYELLHFIALIDIFHNMNFPILHQITFQTHVMKIDLTLITLFLAFLMSLRPEKLKNVRLQSRKGFVSSLQDFELVMTLIKSAFPIGMLLFRQQTEYISESYDYR